MRYEVFNFWHIDSKQELYGILDNWKPDLLYNPDGSIIASSTKEGAQAFIDKNLTKEEK